MFATCDELTPSAGEVAVYADAGETIEDAAAEAVDAESESSLLRFDDVPYERRIVRAVEGKYAAK